MKLKKNTIIIALGAVAVAVGIGLLAAYLYVSQRYDGDSPARVYIPAGATEDDIADSLRSALGSDFGGRVASLRAMQRHKTAARAHGSYLVAPGDRALSVARRLRDGRQSPVNLTFNNIRTLEQLAQRVAATLEVDSAQFMHACDSVLRQRNFTDSRWYVAAFLPDTYQMYWSADGAEVVTRLADYRDRFWNDQRRAQAQALGLRPVQVATLASIVEKESNKRDEQPLIARLYLNRLGRHMPLQADPTVIFATGDFSIRRVRGDMLRLDSPYNTYRYAGLPPGPICMPAPATIDAVLQAPQHDYIYMCAKEDFSGYHNFAADYATHQANARRFQQALNQRGINK